MDELREIREATREVLDAVQTIAERVQPAENARAMLLGTAAAIIAEHMKDGEEPDAATINRTFAERGCPWRIVRVQ